jgi:hypothetical protein
MHMLMLDAIRDVIPATAGVIAMQTAALTPNTLRCAKSPQPVHEKRK